MIKKASVEFVKFCVVGVIATLVGYGAFYVALDILSIYYLWASVIGFVFGVAVGYPLNKCWTFSSKNSQVRHGAPYIATYLFSLAISLIFLRFAVESLGIIPEIANILAIGITTCTNFIGTKFFVFKTR